LKITGFLPFTPENRKVAVMEQGVECSGVTTLRVRALSPRMFFAFALWFMAFLPACLHASFPSCHYYAIVPAF